MRLFFNVFVPVLLVAITLSAKAEEKPTSRHAIKFDYGGCLIVEADVNGGGPYGFVVDTASTAFVLFENMARQIDLVPVEKQDANIISFAGAARHPASQVKSLTVGPVVHKDTSVIVLPDWKDYVRTPQGILGMDFFRGKTAIFDLDTGELQLFETTPESRLRDWSSTSLKSETFGLVSTPLFLVPVKIGRREFRFLLDAGAEASVCNYPAANALKILPKRARLPQQEKTVFDAIGEKAETFQFHPSKVSIAGIDRQNRELLIADSPFFDAVGYGDQPFGLVGLSYLIDSSFAIDFENGTLFIKNP